MRYLLDTNTCSYVHRERPPEVLARFRRLTSGEAVVSVITYGELLFGAGKSAMRTKVIEVLQEFISLVQVLPLSTEVAQTYGSIRANLEVKGISIGGNDLWIAAHAKTAGLTLVTNNEREFRRIPGLKVQNWVE